MKVQSGSLFPIVAFFRRFQDRSWHFSLLLYLRDVVIIPRWSKRNIAARYKKSFNFTASFSVFQVSAAAGKQTSKWYVELNQGLGEYIPKMIPFIELSSFRPDRCADIIINLIQTFFDVIRVASLPEKPLLRSRCNHQSASLITKAARKNNSRFTMEKRKYCPIYPPESSRALTLMK